MSSSSRSARRLSRSRPIVVTASVPGTDERHAAVALLDRSLDDERIPALGVTDIRDRHVVVHAPEERHRIEGLLAPEHVQRGSLALTFGDHPMLDTDLLAAVRIRPRRDVAGREDTGDTRLKVLIDGDAAVQREAGLFRKLKRWRHPRSQRPPGRPRSLLPTQAAPRARKSRGPCPANGTGHHAPHGPCGSGCRSRGP